MPKVLDIIASAYDRLQEAHWNIHQMEEHYHEAEAFRYALNSFLRVIKEVPQILQMELQAKEGFSKWYKERYKTTKADPLISDLFVKRNIVVHQKMLKPKSTASLGITKGRGLKLGLGIPLDPLTDSDEGIVRFLYMLRDNPDLDFLGFFDDEDEDTLPCIERHWGLDPFEEGILELAVKAWELISKLVSDTIVWLGEDPSELHLKLSCIHNSSAVALVMYKREWIKDIKNELNKGMDPYIAISKLKAYRTGIIESP